MVGETTTPQYIIMYMYMCICVYVQPHHRISSGTDYPKHEMMKQLQPHKSQLELGPACGTPFAGVRHYTCGRNTATRGSTKYSELQCKNTS